MTSPHSSPQDLKLRQIDRQRMLHSLVLSAIVATLFAGCNQGRPVSSSSPSPSSPSSAASTASTASTEAIANDTTEPDEQLDAVFYQTTEECEEDVAAQKKEYETLLASYEEGTITEEPTEPVMKIADCEAQMQAALDEHNRNAPTYSSLEECEVNGANCETTTNNSQTYYRPMYGGSYFYPYQSPIWIFFNNHRVYQPYPVYQSSTPGTVITSTGNTLSRSSTGRVIVPRSANFPSSTSTSVQPPTTTPTNRTTTPSTTPSTTTTTTPQRPASSPAQGSVNGRNSSGFGSTYRSTGKGGK